MNKIYYFDENFKKSLSIINNSCAKISDYFFLNNLDTYNEAKECLKLEIVKLKGMKATPDSISIDYYNSHDRPYGICVSIFIYFLLIECYEICDMIIELDFYCERDIDSLLNLRSVRNEVSNEKRLKYLIIMGKKYQ